MPALARNHVTHSFTRAANDDCINGGLCTRTKYGYDVLDRLTSATTSAVTDGWTYDADGNRLTQTGTTPITFSVSSTSNQLTATTGGLVRSYAYDAAGNPTGYGTNGFTYNDRGRASVANSTNYLYNALGQMIEKSGAAGTTVFMQDESGHLLGEYNGSGQLVEETIWLGNTPVATLQPNGSGGVNIFYVHTDHLNSPRKVAQPTTGTLAWRWDTDPFGTAAPNQNPAGLGTFPYNLRFPGQYYDAETGLNQNWNRDYDPVVGRYIESDPIGLSGGTNTYAYAGDAPVSGIDPYGLFDASALGRVVTTAATEAVATDTAGGGPAEPLADAAAVGVAIGSIIYGTYMLCRDDPECERLYVLAEVAKDEVVSRYFMLLYDRYDLYNLAFETRAPNLPGTWIGHQVAFRNAQTSLRNAIRDLLLAGCKPSQDQIDWSTRPMPMKPQNGLRIRYPTK